MVFNQENDFNLMNFQTQGGKSEETLPSSELRQTQFWKWQHRTVHHPSVQGSWHYSSGSQERPHLHTQVCTHWPDTMGRNPHCESMFVIQSNAKGGESRQGIVWEGWRFRGNAVRENDPERLRERWRKTHLGGWRRREGENRLRENPCVCVSCVCVSCALLCERDSSKTWKIRTELLVNLTVHNL